MSFKDANGVEHDHDENSTMFKVTCLNCKKKYSGNACLSKCKCGWTGSNNDLSNCPKPFSFMLN